MQHAPVFVLYRQDLRIHDNPALWQAAQTGAPIIAIYILDDLNPGKRKMGGAQRWWLYQSLKALKKRLGNLGIPLATYLGSTSEILAKLILEFQPQAVYLNQCYEPYFLKEEIEIQKQFPALPFHIYNSALLVEPGLVLNAEGKPYKVYTPFWNSWNKILEVDAVLPIPKYLAAKSNRKLGEEIESWNLLPLNPDWASDFHLSWTPGEEGANVKLEEFLRSHVRDYATMRDIPSERGTSLLAPHIHFGEISVRQIYHQLNHHGLSNRDIGRETFIKELAWREFAYNLLFHFPYMPSTTFQERFRNFPWKNDPVKLHAWQKGMTGYPIVDAGMRQLWKTGYMHNRVRMIVGSFLTKDLLIPWQKGEEWFWDTLLDADLASNAMNWQWVAGCGVDAAPFFRIFNPVLQGEKFDREGEYIKRWVPELSKLPLKYIHRPWEAPPLLLAQCDVTLGKNYPYPVVDHAKARDKALKLFSEWKSS